MSCIIKTTQFFLCLAILAGCGSARNSAKDSSFYVSGDEPVNTGFGRTAKKDVTYSIGHVKNADTEVYNSIYDYFRDKVAGVRVERTGPTSAKIFVRGINSINSSTEPLFIVDGVTMDDISSLNPYDVDSVDVLKDASAAIYGVRGANGVVIITLKKNNK